MEKRLEREAFSSMSETAALDHEQQYRLLEKELEGEIMSAIDRLPEDCQKVFRLSRFEQLKYDEIAQRLNISVNTVKYHIKHALALLHEDLGKYLAAVMVILIESMQ